MTSLGKGDEKHSKFWVACTVPMYYVSHLSEAETKRKPSRASATPSSRIETSPDLLTSYQLHDFVIFRFFHIWEETLTALKGSASQDDWRPQLNLDIPLAHYLGILSRQSCVICSRDWCKERKGTMVLVRETEMAQVVHQFNSAMSEICDFDKGHIEIHIGSGYS